MTTTFIRHCEACGRRLEEREECACAPTPELRLLRGIHRRPALYWGTVENLFDALIAYLAGYNDATTVSQHAGPRLVPAEFHDFVWRRIGSGPMNGHGWTSAIRMVTSSPREAFDLFFTLREEYEREN